jgi:hypothetical protein
MVCEDAIDKTKAVLVTIETVNHVAKPLLSSQGAHI